MRIESPQIALLALPGSVPEFSIQPGDPGDEAVGLDGAKNCSRLRIDLMYFAVSVLPYPQRSFGPRKARVSATPGRRNGREHIAALRIDLLNTVFDDLK